MSCRCNHDHSDHVHIPIFDILPCSVKGCWCTHYDSAPVTDPRFDIIDVRTMT